MKKISDHKNVGRSLPPASQSQHILTAIQIFEDLEIQLKAISGKPELASEDNQRILKIYIKAAKDGLRKLRSK